MKLLSNEQREKRREAQRRYIERHPDRVLRSKREWAERNKEKVRQRQAEYRKSEKGKEYRRLYFQRNKQKIYEVKKRYRKTKSGYESMMRNFYKQLSLHPERHRARQIVNNALLTGKIIKESCKDCGNSKSEAHHDDYTKPLQVDWLCRMCHIKRHSS